MIKKSKQWKIIVCGEGGIGKTSLLLTFQQGVFTERSMTLGLAPVIIRLHRSEGDLGLQVWDLGGQKQFFDMGVYKKYCQGAHGALICFDLSELDTLKKLPSWVDLLPSAIPKLLVGTKKDAGGDISKLVTATLKRLKLTDKFVAYLETSAKNDLTSVYQVFIELLNHITPLSEQEAAQVVQEHVTSRTDFIHAKKEGEAHVNPVQGVG